MKEKVGGRGRGEHEEVGSSRGYLGGCGGGGIGLLFKAFLLDTA